MPSSRPRVLAFALVAATAITLVEQTLVAEWFMGGRVGQAGAAGAAGVSWVATLFDANAARAGIDVGATPRAGAAMVWHSSHFPA